MNSSSYSEDDTGPWPLPEWLPDETFFSLASRYHLISGNRLPEHTSLALFGRKRWGYHHDFPNPLGAFVERTSGRMGSVRAIAESRTILPYYLVHRDEVVASDAYSALSEPDAGMLKFRLGLLTSRFRANHPLRACAECMHADERRYGISYWRRRHQFPGVWVCPEHRTPLLICTVKSNGVERFSWVSPSKENLNSTSLSELVPQALNRFLLLSRLAIAWGESSTSSLDHERLGHLYRQRALDVSGSLSRMDLAAAYCASIAPLRLIGELAGLPASKEQAQHSINRWLFAPRGATHPIRHLSFIHWLFGDWAAFKDAYQSIGNDPAEEIPLETAPLILSVDPRRHEVLARLKNGQSASQAAREIGLSVQTAISWAAAEGIPTPRRPKVLTEDLYENLVAALASGVDKEDAADAHGVSVTTVTRVLRSEVGLSKRWHQARLLRAQSEARSKWIEAIRVYGILGVKTVRESEPAAYAWLYRNDLAWLSDQAVLISSARTNNAAVKWEQRDANLAEEVRRVAAELAPEKKGGSIRLWQLYQAIPELKAKLGALPQLPLTRRAIEAATKRRQRKSTGKSLFE